MIYFLTTPPPVEFIKRAEHLATDNASSFVVIEDVLSQYQNIKFDYFVLLQPTSPLRTAKHIQEACEKFEKNYNNFDYLVSVSEAHKPTSLTRIIDKDESLKYFQLDYSNYTRQQYHLEYSPNGAIFIAKPEAYLLQKHFYGERCQAYFMDKSVSVDIDDRLDFEYFYFLLQKKNKETLLLNLIKERIEYKRFLFEKKEEITLIGHSILEQWNIDNLNGKKVNNLAISDISTKEYISLILEKNMIRQLGKKVIVMTGMNDIINPEWTSNQVLEDIQRLIFKLKKIRSDIEVYFLEIIPVALRADRNNEDIRILNEILRIGLKEVEWIELNNTFSDGYGKLNIRYTNDGLNLNKEGYTLLEKILKSRVC
ncbi:GDSL-type esterase/lipase family protein [Gallibacterium trehalosifermentans]|uniref:GDSL-type esterase/lipase family protein n=1 Tax=Gallibacterium trehalosifermentans TaxID=516935 RepID=A0ABV6GYW6_9PAST